MNRLIYRILIGLHPSVYREQHGDEILCIFEESAAKEAWNLFADALVSLVRQWFFHSGWWKLFAGAAFSSLLVFACGYSISQSFNWSLILATQRQADVLAYYGGSPDSTFNEWEFELEAQQAVRMLTGYRRADERRRRPQTPRPATPAPPRPADCE
jgi:hypothetical protein